MQTKHTHTPPPDGLRGSVALPTEKQEVTLRDIHTDASIVFEKTELDEVHITIGGMARSADVDCGELLLAAQMLAAESDVRPELDGALSAEIDQFLNGTRSRADLIAAVKQIAGGPKTEDGGRRAEDGPKHSAKLYRVLDEVAVELARQSSSGAIPCSCSARRTGALSDPLIQLAHCEIAVDKSRTALIQMAALAVFWAESLTEEVA